MHKSPSQVCALLESPANASARRQQSRVKRAALFQPVCSQPAPTWNAMHRIAFWVEASLVQLRA
jgi:hypothetical protein